MLDLRNLQEQVKKPFCYQKLFWPFTVCSSDLKIFVNSGPSASNFKFFSWSLEQFFLTVDQNNFGNKIPFLWPREKMVTFIAYFSCSFAILQNIFIHLSHPLSNLKFQKIGLSSVFEANTLLRWYFQGRPSVFLQEI